MSLLFFGQLYLLNFCWFNILFHLHFSFSFLQLFETEISHFSQSWFFNILFNFRILYLVFNMRCKLWWLNWRHWFITTSPFLHFFSFILFHHWNSLFNLLFFLLFIFVNKLILWCLILLLQILIFQMIMVWNPPNLINLWFIYICGKLFLVIVRRKHRFKIEWVLLLMLRYLWFVIIVHILRQLLFLLFFQKLVEIVLIKIILIWKASSRCVISLVCKAILLLQFLIWWWVTLSISRITMLSSLWIAKSIVWLTFVISWVSCSSEVMWHINFLFFLLRIVLQIK